MANFEEDTAKKIKEALKNGFPEISAEKEIKEDVIESKPQENVKTEDNLVADNAPKESSIFARALGTAKADTQHFKRKESIDIFRTKYIIQGNYGYLSRNY